MGICTGITKINIKEASFQPTNKNEEDPFSGGLQTRYKQRDDLKGA